MEGERENQGKKKRERWVKRKKGRRGGRGSHTEGTV